MTTSIGFEPPSARPPQNGSAHSTVLKGCPRCSRSLQFSRDMWGKFYVCKDCGFALEDDDELMIGANEDPPKRSRFAGVLGSPHRSTSRPSLPDDVAMLAGLYRTILWMLLQRLRRGQARRYRVVQVGPDRPAWNP